MSALTPLIDVEAAHSWLRAKRASQRFKVGPYLLFELVLSHYARSSGDSAVLNKLIRRQADRSPYLQAE